MPKNNLKNEQYESKTDNLRELIEKWQDKNNPLDKEKIDELVKRIQDYRDQSEKDKQIVPWYPPKPYPSEPWYPWPNHGQYCPWCGTYYYGSHYCYREVSRFPYWCGDNKILCINTSNVTA